ncbi:hypothetical protein ColTof4_12935 [Colletotrichum tofieldiae]|nr:hypothetical protein ColTof3_14213 [Colletotrichum tofieldiae]GKT80512.1 hypothetical protein ColTof4_12935 [Colletotrichum tofieldiae]GKT94871.1 hypothetical protein Ct61P_12721 [Colletotrichum tofieldiae]
MAAKVKGSASEVRVRGGRSWCGCRLRVNAVVFHVPMCLMAVPLDDDQKDSPSYSTRQPNSSPMLIVKYRWREKKQTAAETGQGTQITAIAIFTIEGYAEKRQWYRRRLVADVGGNS